MEDNKNAKRHFDDSSNSESPNKKHCNQQSSSSSSAPDAAELLEVEKAMATLQAFMLRNNVSSLSHGLQTKLENLLPSDVRNTGN
uniref:Uncharacterized protein n=1 Tax=Panagrolaimus sp. ES5 TaxID=591445 RepID=A0AC34F4F3_9BILA